MRNVVVIQGLEGVGSAICRAFQEMGDRVILICDQEDANRENTCQIHTMLPVYSWNLVDEKSCHTGIQAIERKYGPIDILIHAGKACQIIPLHEITLVQWMETVQAHLTSFFCLCQSVVPSLSKRINGRIIAIGSSCATHGKKGWAHYSASQAGIIGFAKSLAIELAPYGTTVNVISMGDIRQKDIEEIDIYTLENAMCSVPLQRMGSPEEVAALALFLASPAASFITGTTLPIDGGRFSSGF